MRRDAPDDAHHPFAQLKGELPLRGGGVVNEAVNHLGPTLRVVLSMNSTWTLPVAVLDLLVPPSARSQS